MHGGGKVEQIYSHTSLVSKSLVTEPYLC